MTTELLRLMPGVFTATAQDGAVHLVRWPHREPLGHLTDAQRSTLHTLAAGPCHPDQLRAGSTLVNRLRARGWLVVEVTDAGHPLYALRPVRPASPQFRPASPQFRPLSSHFGTANSAAGNGDSRAGNGDSRLSRFAMLRRDGDECVLQSPRAWCEISVLDPRVCAVLGMLTVPRSAAELGEWLPAPAAARLLADLRWAGLAVPAGDAEDTELRLCQWSPHDLWFHEQTRLGTRFPVAGRPVGATYWAEGRFPPPPARRDPFPGPVITLPRPDLAAVADPPLSTVLESRRTIRAHDDDHPMDLAQLGEFLYRTARVRAVIPKDDDDQLDRPFPSAGSLHELDLYLAVRHVAGLEPGLYHYDGHDHALRSVCPSNSAVRRLLGDAAAGAELPAAPQLLIVLAARFARVMWKYQALSYALILKNVGVLYQLMYTVATAMGLAPCALGTGDSAAFTEATGLDPLEECSVGEFILGSRP
ncbi:MAG TPA: SagB family peptide dehydrogenase [Actinophytocola sp.]|uniref:SagB/ThcOx family dehydrogenase n=1 Tax=Actinophytocola sp. TaxID=1872138 RepID=UPI002E0AB06A|nr:SagB family peptide dehydrogenase [Actinophytocola sp.]